MKKLLGIILGIMLVVGISGPSMAVDPYADAGSSTLYEAGSGYEANGYAIAIGGANSKVYTPKTGDFSFAGPNFGAAGAYSDQKVKSDSKALAFGLGEVKAEAYGQSLQDSRAITDLGNGNWAIGSQASGASYEAKDKNDVCFIGYSEAEGNARATGGTLTSAANFDIGNTTVGAAGAVTGSMGKAYAGCNKYDTDVWGNGSVEHNSYANRGSGVAFTHGTASYKYVNDGYHNTNGGGLAATGGVSSVTTHRNGSITAQAKSISFSSTCKPVATNGGTHISNIN